MRMKFEVSNSFQTNLYGQTPMRLSSFLFLFYSSFIFKTHTTLSFILAFNFATSFKVHKRCRIFDCTSIELKCDHAAIFTWFLYNLYSLTASRVHFTKKMLAALFAVLAYAASVIRKQLVFRHPLRDATHCSMHLLGLVGTTFLVD